MTGEQGGRLTDELLVGFILTPNYWQYVDKNLEEMGCLDGMREDAC